MAQSSSRQPCVRCPKGLGNIICVGCQQSMCFKHLYEHQQELRSEIDALSCEHDEIQIFFSDQGEKHEDHPLFSRINQWEQKSIQKIQDIANDCRKKIQDYLNEVKTHFKTSMDPLTEELKSSRQTEDFTEIELNKWREQLQQVRKQIDQLQMIDIFYDQELISNTIRLIEVKEKYKRQLPPTLDHKAKWNRIGFTVAGGHSQGAAVNQLSNPYGLDVDNDGTIYVADYLNHRIIEWKPGSTHGRIIAGGDGQDSNYDRLNQPTAVFIETEMNSLIISDCGNRRIVRWSLNSGGHVEVILSDIRCYGLTMDHEKSLYVCDYEKNEVRQYRQGDTIGQVVAGGNGRGDRLDQLHGPWDVFVDQQKTIYVSDYGNHRVMKWLPQAHQGIVVAGGQQSRNHSAILSYPRGLFVDGSESIFVVDQGNHRVMRWMKESQEGHLIVGSNGQGLQSSQLSSPLGLSYDQHGDLYIVDQCNHRIQKFCLESS